MQFKLETPEHQRTAIRSVVEELLYLSFSVPQYITSYFSGVRFPFRVPLVLFWSPSGVPLYTLRAACGYFEGGEVPEEEGWIDASGNGFPPDPKRHFAVHAKGNSMQPKIQDGDICVFDWYKAGTRNGEIVLTECSEKDLDYGGKYTIKKYQSKKLVTEEGWQHTKVELIPLNNDYDTIELDSDKDYRTIGVLKCVLSKE